MWRTRLTLILTYVNQYSCSTRLQFGTNLTTDRKKDLGFTNHFWSILYFQINPTKKIGRILYRHAYRYTIQVSASSIHIWNLQANVHPCRLPGYNFDVLVFVIRLRCAVNCRQISSILHDFRACTGILINHPSTIPSSCNTFCEVLCSLYLF